MEFFIICEKFHPLPRHSSPGWNVVEFFLTVMVFSMKNLHCISLAMLPWTGRLFHWVVRAIKSSFYPLLLDLSAAPDAELSSSSCIFKGLCVLFSADHLIPESDLSAKWHVFSPHVLPLSIAEGSLELHPHPFSLCWCQKSPFVLLRSLHP